jgi:XTP/dITP diphosphohydrolase
MRDVPAEARDAHFTCAVALAKSGTIIARSEGRCEGSIATAPSGAFGFGYDPIFRLAEGRTMAELAPSEKNEISHRARAYRRILPALLEALGLEVASGVAR